MIVQIHSIKGFELSIESIRDQSTNAVMANPYAASWASEQASPVSLQPTEGAKTANTGAADGSGVYFDATQKLAHATLLALKAQSNHSGTPFAGSNATTPTTYAQQPSQTKMGASNNKGNYTHLPKANSSVNSALTLSSINTIPEFQTFMSQMFETLKTINQVPSASQNIDSLNKNSVKALTISNNNYYHQGYDQDSFDLLRSKLKYLADQTQKALALANPSLNIHPPSITPGQKTPDFSKDSTSVPPLNSDNLVTNPHIQKLNETYNSLVSSLQGNVSASSLASFVQNLQHQAHGFSGSGIVVNTSA
jgi:hypothetical protein